MTEKKEQFERIMAAVHAGHGPDAAEMCIEYGFTAHYLVSYMLDMLKQNQNLVPQNEMAVLVLLAEMAAELRHNK